MRTPSKRCLVCKEHHDPPWQSAHVVRRRLIAVVSAVIVALATGAAVADAPPPACAAPVGEPVMLRSSDFDPDVLVWDSRQRSIDYASGNVHSAVDVINHTLLSRPGTRAIVVACAPGTVKPKYTTESLDTIGVKILTGPHRGRYGWVTSDDVRGRTAQASASP
jgi:hypothetical protein